MVATRLDTLLLQTRKLNGAPQVLSLASPKQTKVSRVSVFPVDQEQKHNTVALSRLNKCLRGSTILS